LNTPNFLSIAFVVGILAQIGACSSSVRNYDDDDSGGTAGRAHPSAGSGAQTNEGGMLNGAGETNDGGARDGAQGGAGDGARGGGTPNAGKRNGSGGTRSSGGHGGTAQPETPGGEGGVTNDAGAPSVGGSHTGGGGSSQTGGSSGRAQNGGTGGTGGAGGSPTTPFVTCEPFTTVPVGSYVVESDYWNDTQCPGTQCLSIDTSTGAFSVTEGPACGNTVASYPNVLYGYSFGTESAGSVLPKPVTSLAAVTSTWSFDVGGTSSDQFDVAYDIWFCPTAVCDSTGFAGGLELMIWLNYRNTAGWETDLGSVALSGHDWEVWTFTAGTGASSWTYLAYLIQPSMVTSVTDFDILAFIDDAASRGLLPSTSYLYAIQAGNELRTGGIPYASHEFSVSIE
jgi:hypothetical protein